MKHSAIAAAMIIALGAWTASAATTSTATKVAKTTPAVPSATVTFSGETVAVGVAFTWGKGVLKFKGKTYPFKVSLASWGFGPMSSMVIFSSISRHRFSDAWSGLRRR